VIAKVQCPAKVNLFLEVIGKRKDGYHTIKTLFARISIFDSLEIEPLPVGPVELTVDPGGSAASVPQGSDNLVARAAEAFRRAFRVRCGARIRLRKNIPVGAGLGGGSSDAAGTLLGLSRAFETGTGPRARAALRRVAAGLGADVPFFLQSSAFCVGAGIGDRLTPLEVPKALPWMVLIYPRVLVSTESVYKKLEAGSRSSVLTRLDQLGKLEKKLAAGRPISEWEGLLFNRLEDVVLRSHPVVGQAKRILRNLGARGTLMSGSGSSVFGFVRSHEEGERVRARLQGYPWRVFVASCLG